MNYIIKELELIFSILDSELGDTDLLIDDYTE